MQRGVRTREWSNSFLDTIKCAAHGHLFLSKADTTKFLSRSTESRITITGLEKTRKVMHVLHTFLVSHTIYPYWASMADRILQSRGHETPFSSAGYVHIKSSFCWACTCIYLYIHVYIYNNIHARAQRERKRSVLHKIARSVAEDLSLSGTGEN